MNIILYTTGCPKCKILERKLDEKQFNYTTVTNVKEMLKLGIASAPILQVDEKVMDFGEAVRWINEY